MKTTITNLYAVSALATIGGLIQGFDVSSLSAILATDAYKSYFGHPDALSQGGITASMAGGSLLGALFASWTGDKVGRRDSLSIACAVFIVGSTIMCAAQDRSMLIAARIINGWGVGMLTSQGPIYIAEISRPHLRGRLIALQQWMITWGILIMYFVSYGTSRISGPGAFRIPWGLQMIPALILSGCLPFMPRSPRWLASKDRWEEALTSLAVLHAQGNRSDPDVVTELHEIRQRVALESSYKSTSWAELVKPRNIVRVHCCLFAHIWSQFSGTNAFMYYIVYIFQMAGLTGQVALTSASIQYVINVIMTIPALLFIDKLPRRKVMMTGSFLMATWLFITAAIQATQGHAVPGGLPHSKNITWVVSNKQASRAIIACSYLFIATYACTWGPTGWIYPSEIIPLYIRAKTVSLSVMCNWAGNFALTFFTPVAFENIKWKVYVVFGTFCAAALVHVFFFFQETKGRSLEDMGEIYDLNIFAFGEIKYGECGRNSSLETTKKDVELRERSMEA